MIELKSILNMKTFHQKATPNSLSQLSWHVPKVSLLHQVQHISYDVPRGRILRLDGVGTLQCFWCFWEQFICKTMSLTRLKVESRQQDEIMTAPFLIVRICIERNKGSTSQSNPVRGIYRSSSSSNPLAHSSADSFGKFSSFHSESTNCHWHWDNHYTCCAVCLAARYSQTFSQD